MCILDLHGPFSFSPPPPTSLYRLGPLSIVGVPFGSLCLAANPFLSLTSFPLSFFLSPFLFFYRFCEMAVGSLCGPVLCFIASSQISKVPPNGLLLCLRTCVFAHFFSSFPHLPKTSFNRQHFFFFFWLCSVFLIVVNTGRTSFSLASTNRYRANSMSQLLNTDPNTLFRLGFRALLPLTLPSLFLPF